MSLDADYARFTYRQNLDRSIHTLEGILRGIALDQKVTPAEIHELVQWSHKQQAYADRHPFTEIMPKIELAISDGILTEDEVDDILWLCGNLRTGSIYYDALTSDIQRLHGMLHGFLADGILEDSEIRALRDWVADNEHLRGCYPYDEVDSLLTTVLADGIIEEDERALLKGFLDDFVSLASAPGQASGCGHFALGLCT